MPRRSTNSNPELKFETNEAGIFSEEEVQDILDRLASLLITHWEKTHPKPNSTDSLAVRKEVNQQRET